MREEALFINGVFEVVLADIARVQEQVPEQVLYLQPYSANRIVRLYQWNPTLSDPVRLYVSTSDSLDTVSYVADIVAVRDKSLLDDAPREWIDAVIRELQPTEGGVYMTANGHECRNLLSVCAVSKLKEPFPVADFRLLDTSEHPAGPRQTSGNWWYVLRRF